MWRWGKRESIYTYRYTVTTRMTCIKMDSDDSHFNVSSIVRDKITRQCPQTKVFWRERRAEVDSNQGSSPYQPNALPLGQTCSRQTRDSQSQKYTFNGIFSQICSGLINIISSNIFVQCQHNIYVCRVALRTSE